MKKKEKQLTMDSVSFDFSVLNARPEGMSQAEYRDKRYYESRRLKKYLQWGTIRHVAARMTLTPDGQPVSIIRYPAYRRALGYVAPALADEDTPLNVLRAAAEFATATIKAGEAEGVHELTTCEHGVALPPNGCDGRCLACAGLKALKKLS